MCSGNIMVVREIECVFGTQVRSGVRMCIREIECVVGSQNVCSGNRM